MKIHKHTHTHTHTHTHHSHTQTHTNTFIDRYIQICFLYGYIQIRKHSMITLIFNLNLKLLWIHNINRPCKFPSIIYKRSSIKCFVEWKYLALILSE